MPGAATTTPEVAVPAAPKIRKSEVSASGDFFLGQGNVTLPFGFALSAVGVQGTVNKANRTSDYFGGTVSYSYKHNWFVDLAYADGSSSGSVPVALGGQGYEQLNSNFSIKDQWYQAYLRYTFPALRGTRWSAYLRAGVSYVQATLDAQAPIPSFGLYEESDKTDDLLGNLGFGLSRSIVARQHLRVSLQAEGEGFFGQRTQRIDEALPNDPGVLLQPTSINNSLYGGIGRGTIRFEYWPKRSRALTIFADGGFQAKYSFITYPSGLGSFTELLWGPYIKVGLRYSF